MHTEPGWIPQPPTLVTVELQAAAVATATASSAVRARLTGRRRLRPGTSSGEERSGVAVAPGVGGRRVEPAAEAERAR
jgi:hypothetical protein